MTNVSGSLALLRERIHFNRRQIDNCFRNLLKIHLQLANILSASDWSLVDRITFNKPIRLGDEIRNRQCRKFSRLREAQHPILAVTKDTVVNLSNRPMDDALHSALRKGLNYAVTPTAIPIKNILIGVERAVRSLYIDTAEEVRQEAVRSIKNSKPPRDNLTRAERKALKSSHGRGSDGPACR
jgi:hypothetical protein